MLYISNVKLHLRYFIGVKTLFWALSESLQTFIKFLSDRLQSIQSCIQTFSQNGFAEYQAWIWGRSSSTVVNMITMYTFIIYIFWTAHKVKNPYNACSSPRIMMSAPQFLDFFFSSWRCGTYKSYLPVAAMWYFFNSIWCQNA